MFWNIMGARANLGMCLRPSKITTVLVPTWTRKTEERHGLDEEYFAEGHCTTGTNSFVEPSLFGLHSRRSTS